MRDYTEYSIALDGEVIEGWPTTRDHGQACEDAAEWRFLRPDAKVTIVHRRVRVFDWATTTG